jgi:hypothetical protein
MERLAQFVAPLRTLEPSQWVAFADRLPLAGAVVAVVLGVLAALFGSGGPFRIVAAPLGIVAGIVASPNIASAFHLKLATASWGTAGALGLAGAIYPPILVFGVCGGIGGLFGGALAGSEDFWLGFLPGALICGVASMFALRVLESAVTGLVGGALVVWGLMSIFSLTRTLAGVPSLALGAVGVACLASMVFQLKVRRTEEEAAAAKAKRAEDKRKKQEDAERAARFATYGKKRKAQDPEE